MDDATPPSPAFTPGLAACLLTLAGLAAYANSLDGAFVFDDIGWIPGNPHLTDLRALVGTGTGRPLIQVSLWANYQLGGLRPFGYHAFNLAVHLLAGLTMFALARFTLTRDRWPEATRAAATPLAFAIALLWLVHPLQTQSVTYLIQRCESLMGLFFLLAVYCAAAAGWSARPGLWSAAAVLAALASSACKEVAAVIPVVVLAYDWTFADDPPAAFRRRWPLYAGLLAAGASFFVAGHLVPQPVISTVGFSYKGVTPRDYLLTQAGVLVHYLRLTAAPHPLTLDYFDWPRAAAVRDWLPPGLAVLTLLGATAYGLWRRSWLGFAGAWFFVILAPTSSFVPIADFVFEHRLYLPLAAPAALATAAGWWLAGRLAATPEGRSRAAAGLLAAAALTLGVMTAQRNRLYLSAEAVYADNLAKRPNNHRPAQNLARLLLDRGAEEESKELTERIAPLTPGNGFTLLLQADLAYRDGDLPVATKLQRQAVDRIRPDSAIRRINLARMLLLGGKPTAAEEQLRLAAELAPRSAGPRALMAVALADQAREAEATAEAAEAARLDPKMAVTTRQAGRDLALADAPEKPRRAARVRAEAVLLARQAVLLTAGQDPEALDSLAIALAASGRYKEAVGAARRSLELTADGPGTDGIRQRLALFQAGKPYNLTTARASAAGNTP